MSTETPRSGQLVARLEGPTADDRTVLAVVADPHVATRAEGTMKLFEHTEGSFRAALEDAAARDVDAVLSVGDLTKDGEPWNYAAVDDALADLDVPFHAVPGNHDVPKARDEHETPPVAEFEDRYTPGGLPFHERVGGVDVLGVNSAGDADHLFDSHDGRVPDDQLEWLAERIDAVESPLVLAHHNTEEMADQLREYRDAHEPEMAIPPVTRDPDAFADALAGAPLVLTGHLHLPSAARTGDTWEVMAPTTCSFPQSYLVVTVGPEGTDIELVPVANRAGLSEGYKTRSSDSVTSGGLTALASIRLAEFPLVEER